MGAVLHPADLDAAHVVGLATCHSAEKCGEVIVASEVEYKMFKATGWSFTSDDGATPVVLQSTDGSSHVVLQRNYFDHARMTQSVVVRGPTGVNEIFVKVRREERKGGCAPSSFSLSHFLPSPPPPLTRARTHILQGSFETIAALCKPGSLPAEFATAARQHALEGCYVLALAKRLLGPSVSGSLAACEACCGDARAHAQQEGRVRRSSRVDKPPPLPFHLQPDAAHTDLQRDDIERDLDLMGLIIFRNEIREDSAPTIAKLRVSLAPHQESGVFFLRTLPRRGATQLTMRRTHSVCGKTPSTGRRHPRRDDHRRLAPVRRLHRARERHGALSDAPDSGRVRQQDGGGPVGGDDGPR
jgi:magnesium-transporting ATPase (P-type)